MQLLICLLQADVNCCQEPFRHQLFIGPEAYYVKRTREGGAKQNGYLAGIRAGYDYLRGYAFYVGLEGVYATGRLKGEFGEGEKLRSHLTDANVEGRLGYTFESQSCYQASLTPFAGIGYFWEINKYGKPAYLPIHFENTFYYVPIGFLSRVFITPEISVGLNFKARFLIDGKIKASHDPEWEGSFIMRYEDKVQYRIDLPFTYYWLNQHVAISLVPFYEYRHYGYRINFPQNFLDTQFRLYGADLRFLYLY